MTEYGLFNDEGCVEGQMYSPEEAVQRLAELIATGEIDETDHGLAVLPICSDHDEQPRDTCEECFTDDDDIAV